jgi:hypothetical protein
MDQMWKDYERWLAALAIKKGWGGLVMESFA